MADTADNQGSHSQIEGGWGFDYKTLAVRDARWTIVLLPSAQSARKRRVPYHSRWSWAHEFQNNVIAVSDPTIQLSSSMLGGWFQGVNVNWVLPIVLSHVEAIAKEWGHTWENVCFVGSSLGGFAALQAICYRPSARAFVEIPQIDLRRYSDPSMPIVARYCYGANSMSNIDQRYLHRISVIEAAKKTGEIGKFHYVQKINDPHHFNEHFKNFSTFIQGEGKPINKAGGILETVKHSDLDATGHSPLSKPEHLRRLASFLSL